MAQAILIFAQDEGRGIPRGSHGGRVRIRYRLMNGATAVPNAPITERFTAVEDRYQPDYRGRLLSVLRYRIAGNGSPKFTEPSCLAGGSP